MATLFFICFGVGVGFVILSLIFGQIAGMVDADVSVGAGVSPFKPIVLAVFLTGFGGMGLIFAPIFHVWMALSFAALCGLLLSYLIFRFVVVPLHKWQNTSSHDRQALVGLSAKVSSRIYQGGYGEITYNYGEKILHGPAKSEDGSEILTGTEVVIMYFDEDTHFVKVKD